MTGDNSYEATFGTFATLLGYPYKGRRFAAGHRLHSVGIEPDKVKLAPLYNAEGVCGLTKNLLSLYDIILRVFRSSISPSGGNADAIRRGLVNLLAYSYEVFHCGEDCSHDHKVDVTSYIFEELFIVVMNRKCPHMLPTS